MTLPTESRYNYNAMDLSPNGYILIAVNEGETLKNLFFVICLATFTS